MAKKKKKKNKINFIFFLVSDRNGVETVSNRLFWAVNIHEHFIHKRNVYLTKSTIQNYPLYSARIEFI